MDDEEIIRRREAERKLWRRRRGLPAAPEPTSDLLHDPAHWTVDDLPNWDAVEDLDAVGAHLGDVYHLVEERRSRSRGGSRRGKDTDAILAYLDEGHTQGQAAQRFGKSVDAIKKIVQRRNRGRN